MVCSSIEKLCDGSKLFIDANVSRNLRSASCNVICIKAAKLGNF